MVARTEERFGRVDALVNAAALTDRGDIFDTTEQRFDEIFDVNVRAPFFLIQETVRIMRRRKIAGSIVNIQSMSAHGGQPFITAYCASKGALATLTRNVAHSLLKFRIRVNGLNIGWMSTPGRGRHPEEISWRGRRLAGRGGQGEAVSGASSIPRRWRAPAPISAPTSRGS